MNAHPPAPQPFDRPRTGANHGRKELCLRVAQAVISHADRQHPADALLREELRCRGGLSPGERRHISRMVFAFYRWHGWLDRHAPLIQQIHRATNLADRFQEAPGTFSGEDWRRAVPEWTASWMAWTDDWLKSLQREPRLWLRARPGTGSKVAHQLGDCLPAGAGPLADTLEYRGGTDLFRTAAFHAGAFEIQDISSQIVSLVCAPRPGETWWDACAGEGGKTLHLADLMSNQGLIWASDRVPWRLNQLKRRARRAKIFNYRAVVWNGGSKPPVRTLFDGVLVDAPCSGLGTWQRNPHARWTTTPEDISELVPVQRRLLATAASALKPGGRLVYAVCTLTHAETTEVAAAFEKTHPNFEPLPMSNPFAPGDTLQPVLWLWPQATGGNGMFIAQWRHQTR